MSERQRTTGAARAGEGRREPGGLRRREAIPLAIGSVAGSGILFLPSAVYVEAGRNSLLVWLLSTALCLPMLLMFQDMVRANPGGDSIQAFVRAGLGEVLGRCVPLLFVPLVIVGLPAGALVAGRYLARALGAGEAVTVIAALAVLLAALAVNLAGVRASTRVQHAGTWVLVAMALVLLGSAAGGGRANLSTVTPDAGGLGVLLPGVVLAMWSFAGFENLTFLSRELRRPERDFLPVSATALGLYGLLTVLLTVAIAVRVPRGEVDEVVGLLQLARTLRPRRGVVAAVTVIAFGAMALNAVAWVWGVSRVVARAAAAAILPRALARSGQGGVPRRAVLLLGGLFAVTLTVLVAVPGILVDAVAAASAIFIVLYLLCIVSYLRVRGLAPRPLANLLLLPPLAGSLVQSGWRSLYGAAVLLAALASQLVRRRTGRAEACTAMATPDERIEEITMLDLDRIDRRSLAQALEDHSPDTTWWFDPGTGATQPYRADSASADADHRDPSEHGLIRIGPISSRGADADMEDFVDRVQDARARELLQRAIAGRGAFRRFKDTLLDIQDLRAVWFAFHHARMEQRAIQWLADERLVDPGLAERQVRARQEPHFPGRTSGLDPVEIATAVAADLRSLYGARLRRVVLFGSWARGDAHPESDIDLLVVLDRVDLPWEELRRMDEILWRHSYRNDALVTAVPVGVDELGQRSSPLLIRVQAEGRSVA